MKSLSFSTPHLIVTIGLPGAGKSYFTDHFSDTFKAPIVSWDGVRNDLFNEPEYSKDEDAIVQRVADSQLHELFKTGATILHDGINLTKVSRRDLQKRAKEAGYETLFVWVQTDLASTKQRSKKARKFSDIVFNSYSKQFTAPGAGEPYIVVSGKHTYPSQLKIVLKKLSEVRGLSNPDQTLKVTDRPNSSRRITIR